MLALFDMKNLGRLFVALALALAVVGPACFLMSPNMAAASEMSGGDCESSSGGPSATLDGCPHSDSADSIGVSTQVSKLTPALAAAVVEPVIPSAVRFIEWSAPDAGLASVTTRIRPLRL